MGNRALGYVRRSSRDQLRARRPRFDRLEERQMLTTYTVLNPNDSGAGSLRQAIIDANTNVNVGALDMRDGRSTQTMRVICDRPLHHDGITHRGRLLIGVTVWGIVTWREPVTP